VNEHAFLVTLGIICVIFILLCCGTQILATNDPRRVAAQAALQRAVDECHNAGGLWYKDDMNYSGCVYDARVVAEAVERKRAKAASDAASQ
jgi:hypothetical protein